MPEHGPASQSDDLDSSGTEGIFLSSLLLVRKIAYGRLSRFAEADISDIVQEAALRLVKWRDKHREKSELMTSADWSSFTARTAHNEINRYCLKRSKNGEVPIDEAGSMQECWSGGEENVEVTSLVKKVWREICLLSLYQRRSLLFHSSELLIYFLQCGIEEGRILESLELSEEEWDRIASRLPLTDAEIASIMKPGKVIGDPRLAANAVKKARCDARKKLKGLVR